VFLLLIHLAELSNLINLAQNSNISMGELESSTLQFEVFARQHIRLHHRDVFNIYATISKAFLNDSVSLVDRDVLGYSDMLLSYCTLGM
jgi:hypothetical protein